eukprot:scaffold220769_cov21-Tisochrysis_lutea.AAC.3
MTAHNLVQIALQREHNVVQSWSRATGSQGYRGKEGLQSKILTASLVVQWSREPPGSIQMKTKHKQIRCRVGPGNREFFSREPPGTPCA